LLIATPTKLIAFGAGKPTRPPTQIDGQLTTDN
jgi:hypothetical protein